MYGGVFTATEAGAIGAAGALVFALVRRTLDWRTLWSVMTDTGYVTASLILIIAAGSMFSRFLALSGLPGFLGDWVRDSQFTLTTVLLVYVAIVLVLGTALDSTSTVLISVPIFSPIFKQLGGDLVWVGIITMIAVEIGIITPPLGISPFVVKATLASDPVGRRISLNDIYLGALPFALAAIIVVALIIAFPKLTMVAG